MPVNQGMNPQAAAGKTPGEFGSLRPGFGLGASGWARAPNSPSSRAPCPLSTWGR